MTKNDEKSGEEEEPAQLDRLEFAEIALQQISACPHCPSCRDLATSYFDLYTERANLTCIDGGNKKD